MIGFDPTDEQALIVETVRQFAENEIRPIARSSDESGAIPKEVLAQAHELGLVMTSLPEEYGGGGERSSLTGCLVIEELAWGDLAIALGILSPALLGLPVADCGSNEQRQSLLPSLCGDTFEPGCLALVEPRFGFDAFRPTTRAERQGDEYRIRGDKCFVPWLEGSGPILVVAQEHADQEHAKESNEARKDDGPQIFLVPRGSDGIAQTPEANMGLGGLPTVELSLDVRVPVSARLGGTEGANIHSLVNRGRVGIAAAAVGMARASFELARDYAKEREAFGAPIATKQAIAFMLADMAIEIDAARLLVWEAADALDRGEEATRVVRLAFDKSRRTAMQAADGAVQVFGGHGYIRDYLPEMHLRNAAGLSNFEALCLV